MIWVLTKKISNKKYRRKRVEDASMMEEVHYYIRMSASMGDIWQAQKQRNNIQNRKAETRSLYLHSSTSHPFKWCWVYIEKQRELLHIDMHIIYIGLDRWAILQGSQHVKLSLINFSVAHHFLLFLFWLFCCARLCSTFHFGFVSIKWPEEASYRDLKYSPASHLSNNCFPDFPFI